MGIHVGSTSPGDLEKAILKHLQLHQAAYQFSLWLPKSHWVTHLGSMLHRQKGVLCNTFVMERKHRLVKRFGEDRDNGVATEKGIVEEMTVQHLHDLKKPLVHCNIESPYIANESIQDALRKCLGVSAVCTTGKACKVHCRDISVGDVVLFEECGVICVAEVLWFASDGIRYWTCLAPWPIISQSAVSWKCIVGDASHSCILRPTPALIASCIFSIAAVGEVSQVIVPNVKSVVNVKNPEEL